MISQHEKEVSFAMAQRGKAGGSNETRRVRERMNPDALKKAWEAKGISTPEDWGEWMRRFSVELLRQSPSPSLRGCFALAQAYPPLARELFNAAFVSCWSMLDVPSKNKSLVEALKIAFEAPAIPAEIVQQLLNLAEFMEHDDKGEFSFFFFLFSFFFLQPLHILCSLRLTLVTRSPSYIFIFI